jgi:hypothetical protein
LQAASVEIARLLEGGAHADGDASGS